MCRRCALPNCEVMVVGARDICARHFGLLSDADQKRLDELKPDGRGVYEATLERMVGKIEDRLRRRAIIGVMGRASGYPSGPETA